jgi:hypothetical protein
MAEKRCYNKNLMDFFGEEKVKTREDMRMVKPEFIFLPKFPFLGACRKKFNTFVFLGAWSFLLILIWSTPSEAQRLCKLII